MWLAVCWLYTGPGKPEVRQVSSATHPNPTPILLDSWAMGSCPVRTQHAFDPNIALPPNQDGQPQSQLPPLSDAARGFVTSVCDELARIPHAVDLRKWRGSSPQHHRAMTRKVLERGAALIIDPQLPSSLQGHRSGSPDVLVRVADRPDGQPGYLPVVIAHESLLQRNTTTAEFTWVTPLQEPDPRQAHLSTTQVFRPGREHTLLQGAHHWRLLDDLGLVASPPDGMSGRRRLAGFIGTDDVTMLANLPTCAEDFPRLAVCWLDLDHRFIRTYVPAPTSSSAAESASQHWRRRSVLDRYDHEHSFRVSVARHAMTHSASSDSVRGRRTATRHDSTSGADAPVDHPTNQPGVTPDPASGSSTSARRAPMLRPIVVPECAQCPWWPVCESQLDPDDISLRVTKAPLDVREITTLRDLGIETIHDLAAADLDVVLPLYLPQVQHRPRAETRLRLAAQRATLLHQGRTLARKNDDPIVLPSGQVEIDFDIETSFDDRVYLWGMWVDDPQGLLPETTDPNTCYYVHFSSFSDQDDAAEISLAREAISWLDHVVQRVPDCIIVHYSDYEITHLRHFGTVASDPHMAASVVRLLQSGCFTDLFQTVRRHFLGVHGIGLKAVAQEGAGFHWRDPEPGGLNSQSWWDEAVHSPDPQVRESSRTRVLQYNEDDVRATHAVRAWLRKEYGRR